MRTAIIYLAGSAALVAAGLPAAEPARLDAKAEAAVVPVAPRAEGSEQLALPKLDFRLSIEAACPADASAESLSISVADTSLSLNGEEIGDVLQTTLTLPRRQTSRLKVEEFCQEGEAPVTAETLLVADVFTARLSLRCGINETQSIVYATLPLDVKLECGAANGPGDDQDSSSTVSTARF